MSCPWTAQEIAQVYPYLCNCCTHSPQLKFDWSSSMGRCVLWHLFLCWTGDGLPMTSWRSSPCINGYCIFAEPISCNCCTNSHQLMFNWCTSKCRHAGSQSHILQCCGGYGLHMDSWNGGVVRDMLFCEAIFLLLLHQFIPTQVQCVGMYCHIYPPCSPDDELPTGSRRGTMDRGAYCISCCIGRGPWITDALCQSGFLVT